MTTYMYITEHCEAVWSSNPPRATDSLGRPKVNILEAELHGGLVDITKCVAPNMPPRTGMRASLFLQNFTPEKVREAFVAAARERILSLLPPGASMTQEALNKVLEGCGYHFWSDAISALTKEGELQVHTVPRAQDGTCSMWVTRNMTPVDKQCISGNGRTDGHMSSYIHGYILGSKPVCAFCLKES